MATYVYRKDLEGRYEVDPTQKDKDGNVMDLDYYKAIGYTENYKSLGKNEMGEGNTIEGSTSVSTKSQPSALNTLLQSAGAIIMKRALVLLDDYATQHKIDYKFIGNVHDEIQSEVVTEQAEKFGWLAVECIKAAGISFELRCPLDGEYKVGTTWAETH